MYAVIRTGGKQYKVAPEQRLRVEKLPGAVGDTIELDDVLLTAGDAVKIAVVCRMIAFPELSYVETR